MRTKGKVVSIIGFFFLVAGSQTFADVGAPHDRNHLLECQKKDQIVKLAQILVRKSGDFAQEMINFANPDDVSPEVIKSPVIRLANNDVFPEVISSAYDLNFIAGNFVQIMSQLNCDMLVNKNSIDAFRSEIVANFENVGESAGKLVRLFERAIPRVPNAEYKPIVRQYQDTKKAYDSLKREVDSIASQETNAR